MLKDYIKSQILANFGLNPTSQQSEVVNKLTDFLLESNLGTRPLFILRGYAGTGKTSLVSAVVKTLATINKSCVLMAPTGRAAKVFSHYAGLPAYTIHKRIYKYDMSGYARYKFTLDINKLRDTLFIVDEASMLDGDTQILEDLVKYVFVGVRSKLILLGDSAQLPPVGSLESPALNVDVMRSFGLDVTDYTLTEVVRQENESGILTNATMLRNLIDETSNFCYAAAENQLPPLQFSKDFRKISGTSILERIETSYDKCGVEETAIVCRSNKRANLYNRAIRSQILYYEDELEPGEIIMIAKNNYFWIKAPQSSQDDAVDSAEAETTPSKLTTPFLANGDIAIVRSVCNERELYGFRFADCVITLPDYDDMEFTVTVILDALNADAPSLTDEQGESLFNNVMEDYMHITNKKDRIEALRNDPYYNALQVKYAYAITCHKAQGGQWKRVFIDQGYITPDMITPDYYRWLYTAITRATKRVYMVN